MSLLPISTGTEAEPFAHIQFLIVAQSLSIVVAVLLAEAIFRLHPDVLMLFSQALKVDEKQFIAHNIPLTGQIPRAAHHIMSSYAWVTRVAVLVVVCYVWESLVLHNSRFDLRTQSSINIIHHQCAMGWSCYALRLPLEGHRPDLKGRDFWYLSLLGPLRDVCPYFINNSISSPLDVVDAEQRSIRERQVACWTYPHPGFKDFIASAGISAAVFELILLGFEGLTALLIRHRKRFKAFIDALMIVCLISWALFLIFDAFTSISGWLGRIPAICVVIVMCQARLVSRILHKEVEVRENQETKALARFLGTGLSDDKMVWQQGEDTTESSQNMKSTKLRRAKDKAKHLIHRQSRP